MKLTRYFEPDAEMPKVVCGKKELINFGLSRDFKSFETYQYDGRLYDFYPINQCVIYLHRLEDAMNVIERSWIDTLMETVFTYTDVEECDLIEMLESSIKVEYKYRTQWQNDFFIKHNFYVGDEVKPDNVEFIKR